MQTIFFTDLDDSLFNTARKQTPTDEFDLVTTLQDGSPSAYQSPKQQQFLTLWQDNSLIVPVTARGYDAFSRVQLQFDSYAVINHGGMILDNEGNINQQWHKIQQQHASDTQHWLQSQLDHLIQIGKDLNADIRIKINNDQGLNLYVLMKSNTNNVAMLERIVESYQSSHGKELNEHGYIHFNGNNVAILPNWLGKEYALQYLQNKFTVKYGEFLSIGCGDSVSDLGFMQLCDFWITPTNHSQIDDHLTDN